MQHYVIYGTERRNDNLKETVKSLKGFNKDMTCRGFQCEEGKEYETDTAECCMMPLDVFHYYEPTESVYHEVEQSGELDEIDEG